MTYGKNFSVFFKSNQTIDDQTKQTMLKDLSTGDLLTNLRNYEEDPLIYSNTVIKAIYSELVKRNIICI